MATRNHGIPDPIVAMIRRRSKSMAPRLGICPGDYQDIEQDLLIHAWLKSRHHDPDRGSLGAFLGRVIDHHIGHRLEAAGTQKRGGGVRPLSLDTAVSNADGQPLPLIDRLSDHDLPWGADTLPADERIHLQIDLRRALRGLPERLVALCQRLAQATVAEIARETGVSRTSLYGELGEVRTAFQAAGLDDYLRPPPTDFPRFR